MSKLLESSFSYSKKGVFNAVKYRFLGEITDGRILGRFIGSLAKTVERHLAQEKKWNYKLGLTLSTDTISNFAIHIQRRINWEVLHSRLIAFMESERTIFGESREIEVIITALMLDPQYKDEELTDRLEKLELVKRKTPIKRVKRLKTISK